MDEALESDLQILAKNQGRPVASLVREAISEYLRKERRDTGLKLSFTGAFRSGRRDTADKHEELLWRGLVIHSEAGARAERAKPHSNKQRLNHRKRT